MFIATQFKSETKHKNLQILYSQLKATDHNQLSST